MRGVVGEINSSILLSFNLAFTDGPTLSAKMPLIKNSNAPQKGYFMSLDGEDYASSIILEFADYLNKVTIRLTENRAYPLVKIYTSLPTPDTYNVSEFFITGHFEFNMINVPSQKKSVPGKAVNDFMAAKKRINLLDKLYIQRIGDPLIFSSVIETDLGSIIQYRSSPNIEI